MAIIKDRVDVAKATILTGLAVFLILLVPFWTYTARASSRAYISARASR